MILLLYSNLSLLCHRLKIIEKNNMENKILLLFRDMISNYKLKIYSEYFLISDDSR